MSVLKAKVALVFDWMTTQGGAEKVNLVLHEMFPEAPIFTSVYNPERLSGFEDAEIHTSFIQNLPFAKTKHQYYLGLMPHAYELFDLSDFDIVISSSHACAKGVITKPETMHVCYCHTPMRYAWDNWHTFIKEYKVNPLLKKWAKRRMHKLRIWDRISAERVDHFVANSSTTKARIEKYYRKHATVIPPMINVSKYRVGDGPKGYYLAVGRLTPYKKFDLIVEAFNKLKLPLKIVGTGIMKDYLRKMAEPNIEFLGFVDDKTLTKLYSECEALIFPQVEDFGITPLEAMASGRPVIAYAEGGALDTIMDKKTGILFDKQTPHALAEAVQEYKKMRSKFDPQFIRQYAMGFDRSVFEKRLLNHIKEKWDKWQK
ncbi:MAG: glycosyltransferase [Candidatus Gracilibacteria bacterium]|jgi:glycosyltransferase involved in cell wall biosynthesis